MPVFKVLRRVDAFVDYTADVEAEDAQAAAQDAYDNESHFKWEEVGAVQFDARVFFTLDEDEQEIASTQVGKY